MHLKKIKFRNLNEDSEGIEELKREVRELNEKNKILNYKYDTLKSQQFDMNSKYDTLKSEKFDINSIGSDLKDKSTVFKLIVYNEILSKPISLRSIKK